MTTCVERGLISFNVSNVVVRGGRESGGGRVVEVGGSGGGRGEWWR